MKDFSEQLKALPSKPGVYLMFDETDTIIYVGKAISLKNRVRSYFQKNNPSHTPKVRAMVSHIDRFEYILVENEVEALVLESNFIKQHAPKYNILLRDDKQYPYICITAERFPRLLKVRRVEQDGGRYFGPYPNAYAVNDIIKLLQQVYQIRTCALDFDRGAQLKRPCLNHYIDQCPAPCVSKAAEAVYMAAVDEVERFLKGDDTAIRHYLTSRMQAAAEALKYERAARLRDDLIRLDQLMERQKVSFTSGQDADIIAMARGSNQATVQVFFLRGGKVVDQAHFTIRQAYQEEAGALMSSFLQQFYLDAGYIPKEVLLDVEPDEMQLLQAFLTQRKGQKVNLIVPKRGRKSALMDTVRANAEEQLKKAEQRDDKRERNRDRGLAQLEAMLDLSGIGRIEAYDISNISGVQNVGSMIVYEKARKQPKEYRKFKIRGVSGIDEYASQREMLERRFAHGLEDIAEGRTATGFGVMPSLIIMDGGKGQVNVCEAVLEENNLSIPVVGLVKDDSHHTRALLYRNEAYALEPRSALYRLLYQIQEEVHRFAITYHRRLRDQAMVASELDEIEGVGKVRRQALLKHFGSVAEIRRKSVEELMAAPSMNRGVAERIHAHFRAEMD